MQVAGIICEYNPLHLGHKKQIDFLKAQGYAVVCLISGNFVQRGHPAIFDKMHRAGAAVECGADLVLELPLVSALSSAEGFAAGGVAVLSQLCDTLCFGAENADRDTLLTIADALLSPQFSNALRPHLDAGLSFPAARTKALAELGLQAELLDTPVQYDCVTELKAELQEVLAKIYDIHAKSFADAGQDIRDAERYCLLKSVDDKWSDHIDAMEQLRRGIGLRSYGQVDPVVAYQKEGFDMFEEMITNIGESTITMLYHIRPGQNMERKQQAQENLQANYSDQASRTKKAPAKVGRNSLCPCGSGKKYKDCHGKR